MALSTRSQKNTEAELEIREKRLEEREKQLQEQANALRNEQEQAKRKSMSENCDLSTILQSLSTIQSELNIFKTLPQKLIDLDQRVNELAHTPSATIDTLETLPQPSLKLRDVLPNIPSYDGYRISIYQFARACERARNLLPKSQETALVQLIINKLEGDAYQVAESGQYHTITELLDKLKTIFAPSKTVAQYRGELANIYKYPNETILKYAARVKDLYTAITDCHRRQRQSLDTDFILEINEETRLAFISGLPSELIVRMEYRTINNLDEAIEWAVKLAGIIEHEKIREKIHNRVTPHNAQTSREVPRHIPPNNTSRTNHPPPPIPRPSTFEQPTVSPNTCKYCKNVGHDISNCRKLAYRKAQQNQQSGNENGHPDTQGANRGGSASNTHQIKTEPVWNHPQPGTSQN